MRTGKGNQEEEGYGEEDFGFKREGPSAANRDIFMRMILSVVLGFGKKVGELMMIRDPSEGARFGTAYFLTLS
ncbi:unnamed protein product [Arabis nemorensis]|uniref:Uncharacterized protein n=1 Tax=Arabis nemorensis TaxID=586526 RepID=A0A565AP85_9BRAS|nr:unnamed protein product [Arabis nemorensis]